MMADKLEKLKINRKSLRTAVTKLVNTLDAAVKENPTDIDSIDELLNQLKIKSNSLSEVDRDLDPLIPLNDYEAEKNSTYEYTDKISLAIFRAQKVLNKNSIVTPSVSNSDQNVSSSNTKNFVKLPKLEIPKFAGDCTKFTSFWNTFKCAIHENDNCGVLVDVI